MCDVKMRARQLREHQIARDENLFSDGRIARQSEPRRNRALVDDAPRDEMAIFAVCDHWRFDDP